MPNDPKSDLERYLKAMEDHDVARSWNAQKEIGERYGVKDRPHYVVIRELVRLCFQTAKHQQESTPNVPNNQT